MAEYINREELIKSFALEEDDEPCTLTKILFALIQLTIEKHPAADVVEVRHGEWVHSDKAAHWYGKDKCSECHYRTYDGLDLSHFNYCPNCGAKMDGKGEGE